MVISCFLIVVTGQSRADIALSILPDDEPETTEQVTFTLDKVEPSDLQRLNPASHQVTLYIRENDKPGGTFQFSTQTPSHLTVQVRSIRTYCLVKWETQCTCRINNHWLSFLNFA